MPGSSGTGGGAGGRALERLRLEITGAVQGVGFRPTVYRLATALDLAGWVVNDAHGVRLEVEGERASLEAFRDRLAAGAPPRAHVHEVRETWLPASGATAFEIRESDGAGAPTAAVLPDLATCPECLAEVLAPGDRRHGYAFANCTHCGPRFTIVRELPYDRPHTTMAGFALCPECRREYEDPRDRRFHAQPIACPRCGPKLALWDAAGAPLAAGDAALARAAELIRGGAIVALKGLGGFQLVCDAADEAAIARLRERKVRREKPFALLARDLAQAATLCVLEPAAGRALDSPETPIVLLPRREDAKVARGVAPGLRTLGVMLPATPLHHLLMRALPGPVVATSGNLADEPIAIDEREALERLAGVADAFLVHDRPIERHCDDSVGWMLEGRLALLRRARGVAPLPVAVAAPGPTVLAVGAHLKNTVALALGSQVFVSQHVGDLETPQALAAFERVIADFERLWEARPAAFAHDLHPDYASTVWARDQAARRGVRAIAVQHHHAHLAACLAEHRRADRALGVIWDGTGLGTDGAIWGGEFLLGDAGSFTRVAHLRPFRLPGGEAAVREPRRVAVALLVELLGEEAWRRVELPPIASLARAERAAFERMLASGLNAPVTTSAGRLFDGLAALLGLHPRVGYEGQAAIAFEALANRVESGASLALGTDGSGALELDWRPLLAAALEDLARGAPRERIAARAHGALAEGIVAVAGRVGEPCVALSGGCFQNRLLTEAVATRLRAAGHEVLLHHQVPPNDGGLSLGQAAVARARLAREAR